MWHCWGDFPTRFFSGYILSELHKPVGSQGSTLKSQLAGKLPAKCTHTLPVISHIPLAARQRLFNTSFMHLFTLIRDYVAECESRN